MKSKVSEHAIPETEFLEHLYSAFIELYILYIYNIHPKNNR